MNFSDLGTAAAGDITGAQWLNAGSQVLGSLLKKSPNQNVSSATAVSDVVSAIDASGWSINFGSGSQTGQSGGGGVDARGNASATPAAGVAAALNGVSSMWPVIAIVALGVLAFKVHRA